MGLKLRKLPRYKLSSQCEILTRFAHHYFLNRKIIKGGLNIVADEVSKCLRWVHILIRLEHRIRKQIRNIFETVRRTVIQNRNLRFIIAYRSYFSTGFEFWFLEFLSIEFWKNCRIFNLKKNFEINSLLATIIATALIEQGYFY